MKRIGRTITAYICTVFIISSILHSQPKEPEENQKYNFKAISFSRIPGLEEIYFGEDQDMLRLPSRNFSREMKYEGTIPTIFYGHRLSITSTNTPSIPTIDFQFI